MSGHQPPPGGPYPYGGGPAVPPGHNPYGGPPVPGQAQPYAYPGPVPPPGPPTPPAKRGGAARGLIAVLAVAAVGAAAFLAVRLGDDDGGEESAYSITLPVTSRDFRKAQDVNGLSVSDDGLTGAGITDDGHAEATYLAGLTPEEAAGLTDPADLGNREVVTLGVNAWWGTVEDPERAAPALLAAGAEQAGMTLSGEPERFQPSGVDEAVLYCVQTAAPDPATGTDVRVPVCAWADGQTAAFVAYQRQTAAGTVELPLDEAAQSTADLRTDSLVVITSESAD